MLTLKMLSSILAINIKIHLHQAKVSLMSDQYDLPVDQEAGFKIPELNIRNSGPIGTPPPTYDIIAASFFSFFEFDSIYSNLATFC